VVAVTKYYESARLEGFQMTATLTGGRGVALAFGVGTGASLPVTTDEFLAFPMSASFSGDDAGIGVGEFTLPPDHGFGTEVKALAVGNADPVFNWRAASEDPFTVTVRGTLKLRLSGSGVPTPFKLAHFK
jgi:hypothetical protein